MATRGLFLDQNRGWVVGSKVLYSRHLMAVTPGPRAASTDDVVRDIFFIDDQNGWLVCEVNAYQLKTLEEPRAYLMKTTDGGEHWKRVEIKGLDVDSVLVRAVFSRNGVVGLSVKPDLIYTTQDDGKTWDTVAFADTTSTPGWNLCRQRSWLACRSGRDNHSNLRRRRDVVQSTFPQVENNSLHGDFIYRQSNRMGCGQRRQRLSDHERWSRLAATGVESRRRSV